MAARLLPVLLALVLLAGCLGQDGEPAAPASSREAEGAADAANATLPGAGPVEEGADADLAAPVETPLAWEGRIGRALCAPSPGGCERVDALGSEDDSFLMTGEAATGATLTLTWTASAPTTEELAVGFIALKSCGDDCIEGRLVGDFVSGPSPLALPGLAFDLSPDETLGISVSEPQPCHAVGPGFACASPVEQEFALEGVLLVPARH